MEHTRIAPAERVTAPDGLSFTLTPGMAPAAPLMALLARFDRPKVEAFAEISIALLDLIEPDPDEPDFSPRSDGLPGDPADHEKGGDEEQGAYLEWHGKHPKQRRALHETTLGEEDDELVGDETDHNYAEDEFLNHDHTASFGGSGAGCPVSDPGGCDEGY